MRCLSSLLKCKHKLGLGCGTGFTLATTQTLVLVMSDSGMLRYNPGVMQVLADVGIRTRGSYGRVHLRLCHRLRIHQHLPPYHPGLVCSSSKIYSNIYIKNGKSCVMSFQNMLTPSVQNSVITDGIGHQSFRQVNLVLLCALEMGNICLFCFGLVLFPFSSFSGVYMDSYSERIRGDHLVFSWQPPGR